MPSEPVAQEGTSYLLLSQGLRSPSVLGAEVGLGGAGEARTEGWSHTIPRGLSMAGELVDPSKGYTSVIL